MVVWISTAGKASPRELHMSYEVLLCQLSVAMNAEENTSCVTHDRNRKQPSWMLQRVNLILWMILGLVMTEKCIIFSAYRRNRHPGDGMGWRVVYKL